MHVVTNGEGFCRHCKTSGTNGASIEELSAPGSQAIVWRLEDGRRASGNEGDGGKTSNVLKLLKMAEQLQEMASEFAAGLPVPAPRLPLTQTQPSQSEASQTPTFRLHFISELPKQLFTFDVIRAVGDRPLQVELLDSNFKRVTGRDTKMVEIIVLGGDFESLYEGDDQRAEFNDKDTVYPRDDKGSLLSGKRIIKMENGVGVIDDLKFTDNSSWTRSKFFKLGARVRGIKSNEIVRGAVSNPFRVKDRRGKAPKKHDNPNLNDEVWQLKWIGKGGPNHQQLCQNGILTMKDFLCTYNVDQPSLRKLLKVSEKQWEEIIKQATLCPLIDEMYSSFHPDYNTELVYNCVGEIIGVIVAGRNCQCFDTLNDDEKGLVHEMRLFAYKNKMIRPFGSQAACEDTTSLPNPIGSLTMVASPNPLNPDVGATGLDSLNIPGLDFGTTSSQPLGDPVEVSSIQSVQYHIQEDIASSSWNTPWV